MKIKLFSLMLIVLILLPGCSTLRTDITWEEVVAAYEQAGYHVSAGMYTEKLEHGEIGYVRADHPDGDYIYFLLFETEMQAEDYKNAFYHPVMTGLISVIFGDPSWQRCKVHGCMVIEYDEPELFKVFKKLLTER